MRQQIAVKLGCDLDDRRKEINEIVEKYVHDNQAASESSSESSSESEDEKPARRAAAPKPKTTAVKRKKSSNDSADSATARIKKDASDSDSEAPQRKIAARTKKDASDSDSGVESKVEPKAKAPKAKSAGNAFTRPLKLSPELSALMNAESLPRHEVVKKVWAIIKERNLYDPKNKQFAICDAELQVVMGVKRFRTFGMLKYLKKHFVE